MFKEINLDWFKTKYPSLSLNEDRTKISGIIEFVCAYNPEREQFLDISSGNINTIGGIVLSGKYNVEIKEADDNLRRLPALFLDPKEVELSVNCHINIKDKSACLCGPMEEADFFDQKITINTYLDRLVLPFLYGQVYYDRYKSWPWPEYSHGAIGALESYSLCNDSSFAGYFLTRLQQDVSTWIRIRPLLIQKKEIKGHAICICGSQNFIRRCHPAIWRILNQLRLDLKKQNLKIR